MLKWLFSGNLFDIPTLLYIDMRSGQIIVFSLCLLFGQIYTGCELFDRHGFCDKYNSEELTLNDTIDFNYSELYCNSKYELRLSFDSLSDGRCPIGAWCIWEGTARINFIVQSSSASTHIFSLFTHNSLLNDTVIDGIGYELIDVLPYPELEKNYQEEDYILRLFISD